MSSEKQESSSGSCLDFGSGSLRIGVHQGQTDEKKKKNKSVVSFSKTVYRVNIGGVTRYTDICHHDTLIDKLVTILQED
jgi:hypothetical protein